MTQEGYLIKRTLKPEIVAAETEKAAAEGAEFRHEPEYYHPGGYEFADRDKPKSCRIGWYTLAAAYDALETHRLEAERQGMLGWHDWQRYDYRVVRLTITEEDPCFDGPWCCDRCGKAYTREEFENLYWYDGVRCEEPDPDKDDDDVRCGGIVTHIKKEEA